jgi:hypothetical protein
MKPESVVVPVSAPVVLESQLKLVIPVAALNCRVP